MLVLVLSPQGGTRTRSGWAFEYHFIEYEHEHDWSMINVGNVKAQGQWGSGVDFVSGMALATGNCF